MASTNPLPTNPTAGDLVRAGALIRALKRLAQGWSDEAILLNLEASFVGAQPEQYKAILRLAHRAAAAARQTQQLTAGQSIDLGDIPTVPQD